MRFSKKFVDESKKIEEGLKKVSEKLIAEAKASNSYLLVADEEGNIKKVFPRN